MRNLIYTLLFPLATPLPTPPPTTPSVPSTSITSSSSTQATCQSFYPDPLLPGPYRIFTKPRDHHTPHPGGETQVTKPYNCSGTPESPGTTTSCPIDETYPMVLRMEPYIYISETGEYINPTPNPAQDRTLNVTTRNNKNRGDQRNNNHDNDAQWWQDILNLVSRSTTVDQRKELGAVNFSNPIYYNFTLPSHIRSIDVGRTAYIAFLPIQSYFSGVLGGCTGTLERVERKQVSVCGYLFEDGYGMDVAVGERRHQGWVDQVDVDNVNGMGTGWVSPQRAEKFDWSAVEGMSTKQSERISSTNGDGAGEL